MDAGTISVEGMPVQLSTPGDAQRLGIGVIYQDFKLVPHLSVAENITPRGANRCSAGRPLIDRNAMHRERRRRAPDARARRSPPGRVVDDLSVAQRQMVEIAKALSRNVRILAMDEPTAPLTDRETESLFGVIRTLKARGVGIIYISHRLEEIFRGRRPGDGPARRHAGPRLRHRRIDRRGLIRPMVGRELENEYPRAALSRGRRSSRSRTSRSDRISDVSLTLYRGEVLGLAGLVGAGRTELAQAPLRRRQDDRGDGSSSTGRRSPPHSPHEAIKARGSGS